MTAWSTRKVHQGIGGPAARSDRANGASWRITTAGENAKKQVGIDAMEMPPRSPDLNVLDYSLWAEISRHLRKQERKFPKSKKESKADFIKRLRKTAMGLPASVVRKAVEDMQARCKKIDEAKGGLIDE